ncbi:uncharacterized protein LOC118220767 isoform X3 [Anguilla anguilla]|uniref:uncharacterized protein LOC118220767 isoform X3 n=1 Tax=Anguilla anguilla TaxID=7936 RepID=UPI0015A7EA82|nr:uncharacterized protein LOC118220767 isoform X3 [Anguilla anguilla]
MPHVLCLLLFVLSCTNSVTCSLIFATTGKDVTLRCQCSKNRNCHEGVIRWVRMDSNESLQIIDNKYVWTDSSEVDLLNEWTGEGGSPELDWSEAQTPNTSQGFISEWRNETKASDFLDVRHTELRCVVTRLSAPWVNIYWRSTRESWNKTGQTWSLTDTERGYRVESRLRNGLKVMSGWEHEYDYKYWSPDYLPMGMDLDKMVKMDEELWCEVQVWVNVSVQSPKFSFRQQTHTDSEWCNGVLYGEIAFCVLCVCLLTLLICHCLRHQHKGSEPSATEVSPTLNSCRDVSSDTTYALVIKKQPKTEMIKTEEQTEEQSGRQTGVQRSEIQM